MKKNNLFALSLATISSLGIAASLLFTRVGAKSAVVASAYSDADFGGETELVNGEELTVNINNFSTTDYGVSLGVKFATGSESLTNDTSKYYVVGNDETFVNSVKEFDALDDEERQAWRDEVEYGERETEFFEATLFRVNYDVVDVFVPRTMSRGTYGLNDVYTATINTISEYALPNGSSAEKIYIPKEIEVIPAHAFAFGNHLTDIYVEYLESEKPEDWAENWNHGVTVHWGSEISYPAKNEHMEISLVKNVGDESVNFITGYFPANGEAKPLVVEYKFVGDTNKRYLELSKNSRKLPYDAVGKGITDYSNSVNINIDVQKGKQIDESSIIIHNIYRAVKNDGLNFEPEKDGSGNLVAHKIVPVASYNDVFNLNDFIKVKFQSISVFNGYTTINSRVDVVDHGMVYKTLRPAQYQIFKEQLESGAARIRYRFTGLTTSAKYRLAFGEKDLLKSVDTPYSQYIFEKELDNNISFVIKDSFVEDSSYNPHYLKSFGLTDANIALDIVVGNSIYSSTRVELNFGTIYFMAPDDNIKVFDINLFMILTVVIYSALALALGTFLFFYFKNKYKNDEFRRLKPKQFIKKGIIYWLTSTVVVLAIESVVLRLTALKNSIVVYNPIDVLIVVFGIATIIIIGYYVRAISIAYKANKQKKKAVKLGMVNEKAADDGTK